MTQGRLSTTLLQGSMFLQDPGGHIHEQHREVAPPDKASALYDDILCTSVQPERKLFFTVHGIDAPESNGSYKVMSLSRARAPASGPCSCIQGNNCDAYNFLTSILGITDICNHHNDRPAPDDVGRTGSTASQTADETMLDIDDGDLWNVDSQSRNIRSQSAGIPA